MKKDNTKLIGAILFVFFFIIYAFTAQRDIGFTDAGELAGACASLGVAHPTGYPLFTLFGALWAHVPNPFAGALWMNLISAFWTATTVSTLFLLLDRTLGFIWKGEEYKVDLAAVISASLFGISQSAWGQATSIEVYPLQMFMFVSTILLFLKTYLFDDSFKKYKYIWAFVLGLSFSNHMTTVLLAPAFLYLFFKRDNSKFNFSKNRFKEITPLIAPFLLGISLYLYLPIRSMSEPIFDWGGVSRSFDKFIYHVSGKQFQVWMFTGSKAFNENLLKFANLFFTNFIWTLFIPILIGIYYAFKKNRSLFYFVSLLIIGCLFYSLNYSIHDIEEYFSLAIIAFFIFLAIGLRFLFEKFPKVSPILFSCAFLFALIFNHPKMDESENYLVGDYTKAMVENLEPNAIIFSSQWDYFVSAFWFKQYYENLRPDVAVIDQELLRRTWYPIKLLKRYPDIFKELEEEYSEYMSDLELFESGKDYDNNRIQTRYINLINGIIDKNIGKRPIYITNEVIGKERAIANKYYLKHEGLPIRILTDTSYTKDVLPNLDRFIGTARNRSGHLENGIRELASFTLSSIAIQSMNEGKIETAKKAAELAIKANKKNSRAKAILDNIKK